MSDKIVVVRVELRCAVREGTYGADAYERLDMPNCKHPKDVLPQMQKLTVQRDFLK